MASLTHWDCAAQFSGFDAAALILGIEPRESDGDHSRIRVVIDRMELHYNHALKRRCKEAFQVFVPDFLDIEAARPLELASVTMNELCIQYNSDDDDVTPFTDWLVSDHESQFDNQIFSRGVVADWLSAIKLNSIYQFRLDQPSKSSEISLESEIDPTDLPPELDAANMAFRAIAKGYGDQSTTQRNRLVNYLEKQFPNFKRDAVQRIATVANPDKSTGRKKSGKE